jgi:hypothetical protein
MLLSVIPFSGFTTLACFAWIALVSDGVPAAPPVPSASDAWQTAQRIGRPPSVAVA